MLPDFISTSKQAEMIAYVREHATVERYSGKWMATIQMAGFDLNKIADTKEDAVNILGISVSMSITVRKRFKFKYSNSEYHLRGLLHYLRIFNALDTREDYPMIGNPSTEVLIETLRDHVRNSNQTV